MKSEISVAAAVSDSSSAFCAAVSDFLYGISPESSKIEDTGSLMKEVRSSGRASSKCPEEEESKTSLGSKGFSSSSKIGEEALRSSSSERDLLLPFQTQMQHRLKDQLVMSLVMIVVLVDLGMDEQSDHHMAGTNRKEPIIFWLIFIIFRSLDFHIIIIRLIRGWKIQSKQVYFHGHPVGIQIKLLDNRGVIKSSPGEQIKILPLLNNHVSYQTFYDLKAETPAC